MNYNRAPRELVNLYIEQLFGHNGHRKIATTDEIEPYTWIAETRGSYELWLSYAKLEIHETPRRTKLGDCQLTQSTPEHDEYLKRASQKDVDAYVDWAFTKSKAKFWRTGYKDHYIKYFVSAVHFWFFMFCERTRPFRPLSPETTHDFFRHPLFFVANYTGAFPFVVPEYFFRDDADFDGLRDPRATSYYIFPYFAQRLFEYAAIPHTERNGSFAVYYVTREPAWFAPADSLDVGRLTDPHSVFRRNWRWKEVLEMLWSRKGASGGPHPSWCQSPPRAYHENQEISTYLNCFARMADAWMEGQS